MDLQAVYQNGLYFTTNIYFVERAGTVKFYDGAAKTVKVMGKISVWGQQDNALFGVVLHPNYDNNRWMYLWFSPKERMGENRLLRLARVIVKSDNTFDTTGMKLLINIKGSKTDTWHSGGPMTFDAYGDLWMSIGNNSNDLVNSNELILDSCSVLSKTDSSNSAEWGPSNTASMRGGFLRIHPDSSSRGYSIPRGNFGEYWADQFDKQGKTALAAQYRDPVKVLPEVYVKGERSNFSIAVHPTKRWLAWGTVNWGDKLDEFNITDHPVFTGYPYFMADNKKSCTSITMNPLTPMNTSNYNNGVTELPPATPGAINNLVNVAIGGPIYVFDRSLVSDVKFPPHFHNKWLIGSWKTSDMWATTLDTVTLKVKDTQKIDTGIFKSFALRNYVQAMYGKEGALYILNYSGDAYNNVTPRNPGIMRITYTGSCKPAVVSNAPIPKREAYLKIWLSQTSLNVAEKGQHTFSLFNLHGDRVFNAEGMQGTEYSFGKISKQNHLEAGVYAIKVQTDQGNFVRQASLF
jgi:cytochrome c